MKTGYVRGLFHDVLLDPNSVFDQRTVKGIIRGQARGHFNSERLFGLLLFELWRREYRVAL